MAQVSALSPDLVASSRMFEPTAEGVALCAPEGDTEPARSLRRTLCGLRRGGDGVESPRLLLKGAKPPTDGKLVVEGWASTSISPDRDVRVVATFAEDGANLTKLEVVPDPTDERADLSLGHFAGFRFRIERLVYDVAAPDADARLQVQGRVVAPGVGSLPLTLRTSRDGVVILSAKDLKSSLDQVVSLAGAGDPLSPIREVVTTCLRTADVPIDTVEIGIDPGEGDIAFFRVATGKAHTWDVIADAPGKLRLDRLRLDLKVVSPADQRHRRLVATLEGSVTIAQKSLPSVTLTNERGPRNPTGRWLLMPTEPVSLDLAPALEWAGTSPDDLPEWARQLVENLKFERLAIGLDPTTARIDLLRGAITWTKPEGGRAGRALAVPGSGQAKAELARVEIGLEIENPFGGGAPRRTWSFGVAARLMGNDFELSGWKSGDEWVLRGGCPGDLSIKTLMTDIVGGLGSGGEGADKLFGAFDLTLRGVNVSLSSDKTFSFSSTVLTGSTIKIGSGELLFKPGRIQVVSRSGAGTRFTLEAGICLRMSVGLNLEDFSMFVARDTMIQPATTSVSLQSAISFQPRGAAEPVRLAIAGEYSSAGGFSFRFESRKIPLTPLVAALLGRDEMPASFPELTARDLIFDTAAGVYQGTATATKFMVGDVSVEDSQLTVKLHTKDSASRGARVYLHGVARIDGFEVSLTLSFDGVTTEVTALFKNDVSPARFAQMFPSAGKEAGAGDGIMLEGLGFYYRSTSATPAPAPKETTQQAVAHFAAGGGLAERMAVAQPLPGDGKPPAPVETIAFFTDLGSLGKLDLALQRPPPTRDGEKKGLELVALMRPRVSWLKEGSELGWASAAFSAAPLCPEKAPGADAAGPPRNKDVRQGLHVDGAFLLQGTFFERRLGLKGELGLKVGDKIVIQPPNDAKPIVLDVSGKVRPPEGAAKKPAALSDGTTGAALTPGGTLQTTPGGTTAKPAEGRPADKAGEKTVRFETTLSPKLVIDAFSPAKDGASTAGTWREYVGNCLVVSDIGVTLHTKPRLAATVFADVAVNVGTWVTVAAKALSVKYAPATPAVPAKGAVAARPATATTPAVPAEPEVAAKPAVPAQLDFGLQGAALSVNVPPWFKGGAAVLMNEVEGGFQIVGLGELSLLQKIRIGALAFAQWNRNATGGHDLHAGFGFVFATGFAVAIPPLPILITGIAGGFGYRAVPRLPTRAEDVPRNELLRSLRGKASPSSSSTAPDTTAKGMLDRLESFRASVAVQEDAWCIVFGLTLSIAQAVDAALLVVVESRKTGLELALMGVASVSLGKGADTLGEIELSVLARYSTSAGALIVLGAVTGDSWLFDRKCRLQGGFAICFWFTGEHQGDFLVSAGGYSPLVPTRAHYPALDRVGFKWQVDDNLYISGLAYVAFDRYGLQLGCAAALQYTSPRIKVDASFSFDALVEWAPLYYEARLRMNAHVEVKMLATLRLGLDVDMHLWGPPFGAKVNASIEIGFFSASFAVDVGQPRAVAWARREAVGLPEVVTLAAGGEKASTFTFSAGGNPARLVEKAPPEISPTGRKHWFEAERPCATDDVRLSLETAIPATQLFRDQARTALVRDATGERGLELRARAWRKISSDLSVLLFHVRDGVRGGQITQGWDVATEEKQPLESLWCLPEDTKKPWLVKPRALITAVHVTPARTNSGQEIAGVRLDPVEMERTANAPETVELTTAPPERAKAPADVAAALKKDRAGIFGALTKAGFDLGDCPKRTGFRPRRTTRPLMTKLCP
jgi:hypothetical protein